MEPIIRNVEVKSVLTKSNLPVSDYYSRDSFIISFISAKPIV